MKVHRGAEVVVVVVVFLAVSLGFARVGAAWSIGSQLDYTGCHEPITAEALRRARATLSTAPPLTPTRDEAALIDDVQFVPAADMKGDLAGMSLLLGVRDNDLKGHNPLDSLQLVEVHGNPDTQEEHCIRGLHDDGSAGDQSALTACRTFIRERATEALAGLDAGGVVDPTQRMELTIYVSFAGQIHPALPLFYVKMGQAMHALEDGFTHTYRTADGMLVTVVMNYVEYVTSGTPDPARDGPGHLMALDHCGNHDPTVERNFRLATQAATELLMVALDPARTKAEKTAAFDVVTAKYLTYQPGCTLANHWCDAIEPKIVDTAGCDASAGGDTPPWPALILGAAALLLATRRRRGALALAGVLVVAVAGVAPARADEAPDDKPAVTVVPVVAGDAAAARAGKEPGRDEATPTVAEVKAIRKDKRLGNVWGFAGALGASMVHGAGVATVGVRYRLNERWITGLDVEWNPWVTSIPLTVKAGAINVSAVIIHRFPMKFDRFNLRTSLHLGMSTLLFDVAGAPQYDMGVYAAFTPLGLDYDLGRSVRLVLDPVEIALPVPHLGTIPLYYEQFRLMFGVQIGA